MRRILIIADSRGRPLNQQLYTINWQLLGFVLYILFFPGATIQSGTSRALKLMGNMQFDICYIYLGVNNLSTWIGPRNIQPIYTCRYMLVLYLIQEFISARTRLRFNSDRIVICELTGLNFDMYNIGSGRAFPCEQQELNAGIILLNQHIRLLNDQSGTHSPHLVNFTHKQRAELNNLSHRYSATTRDGIHFKRHINSALLDRFITATIQQL